VFECLSHLHCESTKTLVLFATTIHLKKKISSKIVKVCTNEGNFYFSNNACDATNAVVIDDTCVSNKSI